MFLRTSSLKLVFISNKIQPHHVAAAERIQQTLRECEGSYSMGMLRNLGANLETGKAYFNLTTEKAESPPFLCNASLRWMHAGIAILYWDLSLRTYSLGV